MPPRRTVTLQDVAREAGVSVSTASRTLNGRPAKVGIETQERVRAIARRLGYATNLGAQALVLGQSRAVGLIVGSVPEDYQNPVLAGIFRAAARRDMVVTTAVSGISDVERTGQAVRQLRGQRPATVFVVGTEGPDAPGVRELLEELAHVESDGCRVVMIGIGGTPFDSVVVDDYQAGAVMAQTFFSLGYTDVSLLAGVGPGELSAQRTSGFIETMASLGTVIPPTQVLWQEFSHDGGYRGAGELLRRRPRPQAIFCVNDAMAIGACVRLREQGVRIGPEIAVAGCDDIPALRDFDPPLTTMHLPWTEAAEHAFELASYERSAERAVVLKGHPVVRASTPERG
ncbi:MAG TPA: LacI family DNA-binding transcriptional regulator [Microbacterium sp.]|uniref:LacI family DNA-binding transcriptional regulator n=1 Tax=Microbacterium sp. TaxID=51671 RepID=UPI002BA4C99C|nr:LacI family DNA-binding transcriptional regulator [Microbacterium sp.]HWI30058.1 LacI family DNA-binding transcriptional regulator [Microbacterium sp.]